MWLLTFNKYALWLLGIVATAVFNLDVQAVVCFVGAIIISSIQAATIHLKGN